jgi:hypothetical protein
VQGCVASLGPAVVAQAQRPGVGHEGVQEVLGDLVGIPAQLAGRLGQLVFAVRVGEVVLGHVADVGDVHDVADRMAGPLEHPAHQIAQQEAAKVSDVRERIDRRPTAVHADGRPRLEGDELFHGLRERIGQAQRHGRRAS